MLGAEALQRFIDREPLRRVHEAVFGILAVLLREISGLAAVSLQPAAGAPCGLTRMCMTPP